MKIVIIHNVPQHTCVLNIDVIEGQQLLYFHSLVMYWNIEYEYVCVINKII